jgi:hypothetical protein
MHSDPVLPDAAPGQRVSVAGTIWFHYGANIDREFRKAQARYTSRDAR